MRHTRYILLMTLLVAAIATERFVASATARPAPLTELTQVARQLARRISRKETKPSRAILHYRQRLSLRRLLLKLSRLQPMEVARPAFTPFLFRLPPPVCC